ncbi:MAG: ABC transporter permease [Anaerolineales bacterium]
MTVTHSVASAARLTDPISMVRHLWRHRDLTSQLIRREVGQRYRGSYLGILWSFATPIFMLAVYTFVFSGIFKVRWAGSAEATPPAEFALILFAGLIPFNIFSEVILRSPNLILSVPNYVKKVVFPLEILPVVALGSSIVYSWISVSVLLVAIGLLLGSVSWFLFLLPLAYLPLILLTLAASWLLASLGVYLRDIGQGIGIAAQALFFTSPIFYPPTAIPEPYRFLVYLNPLTPILGNFRYALLGQGEFNWGLWLGWTFGSGVLAWLGYVWFMKMRKGFSDVL